MPALLVCLARQRSQLRRARSLASHQAGAVAAGELEGPDTADRRCDGSAVQFPKPLDEPLVVVGGELPEGRDALVDRVQPEPEEARPERLAGVFGLDVSVEYLRQYRGNLGAGDLALDFAELGPFTEAVGVLGSVDQPTTKVREGRCLDGDSA